MRRTYLVRQLRPNALERGGLIIPETLELPGGFASPNLTLEQSANRELAEEIGRQATNMTQVMQMYPSSGLSNEVDTIFWGTKLVDVSGIHSEEATEADMTFVQAKFGDLYRQLSKMSEHQRPISAQTFAALSQAAFLAGILTLKD